MRATWLLRFFRHFSRNSFVTNVVICPSTAGIIYARKNIALVWIPWPGTAILSHTWSLSTSLRQFGSGGAEMFGVYCKVTRRLGRSRSRPSVSFQSGAWTYKSDLPSSQIVIHIDLPIVCSAREPRSRKERRSLTVDTYWKYISGGLEVGKYNNGRSKRATGDWREKSTKENIYFSDY